MKESRKFLRAVALLAGIGTLTVCASASAAPVANFSNPQPISIPLTGNASPYPSTIVVSGLAGLTTDVNVTVRNMSHTRPHDVDLVLVGPGGQALLLDGGAGSTPLVDVTTIFDDSASTQLPNTTWASGTYKPASYVSGDSFPAPGPGLSYGNPGPDSGGTATLNSTFVASPTNPNGTWNLYVEDFTNLESGTIAGGWSLQLGTTIPDTTAPETTIETAPNGTIPSATATFSFVANEYATFECSLDGAGFSACTSPKAYSSLSEGLHTVLVRATDPTANVDPTPAAVAFSVDTVAPQTTIDSGPTGTISASNATFAFSASEAAVFECKLDSAAFAACASPQEYTGLADGQHTFQLRATDAAGNVDRTGASRTFTVGDTGRPIATVDKPRPKRGKSKAKVTFGAIDDRTSIEALTFTCALDGGAAAACTSPTTYRNLALGKHRVTVVAADLAGNASLPVSASFKIKRR